jgi:hypothetical protein
MTQDIGNNGNKIPTTIPSLSDDANIVDALRLYHYGAKNEPSVLGPNSVAGQIDAKINKSAVNVNANSNLNNILDIGYYFVSSTATISNIPTYVNLDGTTTTSQYSGILHVYGNSSNLSQIYFSLNNNNTSPLKSQISYRNKIESTWSDWKTISSTDHNHDTRYTTTTTMNTTFDTKPTQMLGYKDSTTSYPIPTGNKKIVITAPNSGGTQPNITGYTPQEGDLWFW